MKVKALLYTTKAKPDLVKRNIFAGVEPAYFTFKENIEDKLNGKIIAECDFEVEEIENTIDDINASHLQLFTDKLTEEELFEHSCLSHYEMFSYLKNDFSKTGEPRGYAIHIKNLRIFDEPKELREYYTNRIYTKIEDVYTDEIQTNGSEWIRPIKKAPQNMMYAYDTDGNKYVLISIQPQWLCKILNGEKTIEIRKKVLKEMLEDAKNI